MLNVNEIKKLNTKNISVNTDITKSRFNNLWDKSTNEKKNEVVDLGGYKDTRAFVNIRNKGQVSVRMIIAASIAFNVNPFWLNGEPAITNKGCTETSINDFLKKYGFEEYCTNISSNITKKNEIIKRISEVLNELNDYEFEKLSDISDEEYVILLKSKLIKSKNNFDYQLEAIKILLLN